MLVRYLIFIALLILKAGCFPGSDSRIPSDMLDEREMKSILKDVHLAEAYLAEKPLRKDLKDSARTDWYARIMKHHRTDIETYNNSLHFYLEHAHILEKMYDDIIEDIGRPDAFE